MDREPGLLIGVLHAARRLPAWLIFDVGQVKMLRYQALLIALGMLAVACSPGVKKVDACALFVRPLEHADQEFETTASISLAFEESQLWCDQFKPTPHMIGIWVDWDREAIKKKSPEFFRVLEDAFAKAARWSGGLSGTMRFRGRLEVSDTILKTGPDGTPRRMGFGHLGAFGFRVIIHDVLDYRPNKAPEPTPGTVTPRASDPKEK